MQKKKERRGERNRREMKTEQERDGEGGKGGKEGKEGKEGRGLWKVGKFKGEDLCRLESIRLIRGRLNVK